MSKCACRLLLQKVQNVQECDATTDAIKNFSREQKIKKLFDDKYMKRLKKILLVLLVLLIAIQLIQPAHNENVQQLPTDIVATYKVPDSVFSVLKVACYDCHSNNTRYPWYSNIQPMAWMMASHISNGKNELNFSEFGGYSIRRQTSKFKSITDQVRDGVMPLWSYQLMHKDANLSDAEKKSIINWAQNLKDSLSAGN